MEMKLFGHTKRKYKELIQVSINYLDNGIHLDERANMTEETVWCYQRKTYARGVPFICTGLRRSFLTPGTLSYSLGFMEKLSRTKDPHTYKYFSYLCHFDSFNQLHRYYCCNVHLKSCHGLNNHTELRWVVCVAFLVGSIFLPFP